MSTLVEIALRQGEREVARAVLAAQPKKRQRDVAEYARSRLAYAGRMEDYAWLARQFPPMSDTRRRDEPVALVKHFAKV